MRRKKIGIVIPPASAGGVHQYALSIAQSLITHDRERDYAMLHDTGERPELFGIPDGTTVEFIARDNPYLGPRIHRSRGYIRPGTQGFSTPQTPVASLKASRGNRV